MSHLGDLKKKQKFPKRDLVLFLLISNFLNSLANAETKITSTGTSHWAENDRKQQADHADMILIPQGTFLMGCETCEMPDALPVHKVELDAFWMDVAPVTNKAYLNFVKATHYKTIAEQIPSPIDFPDAREDQLVAGSLVFSPPTSWVSLLMPYSWWKYIQGASWRHPEGPKSQYQDEHPAVHIAWDDANAYCQWQRKQLPTEAQFEFAARGGLDKKLYSWGNELKPGGKWQANIWQGNFPRENTGEDGYLRTSPVKAFPPNAYGLYDMTGNVWQWCSDWYRPDTYSIRVGAKNLIRNPQGPVDSFDPLEPGIKKRVQKGGSFLCSDHYCKRYLLGSRGKGAIDSASSNLGFRCIAEVQSIY
ncbi:MAG: formylglycine-generating enzyme family protein [Proteobacteria bacterium]|nr:formylglycine-generating enzyme family protein [Pseudomonadota bacterium]